MPIATEAAYAPWAFVQDGQLVGFEIELADDLCRRMNARCTVTNQDWDGVIPGLVAGRYDAIIADMVITEFSRPKLSAGETGSDGASHVS